MFGSYLSCVDVLVVAACVLVLSVVVFLAVKTVKLFNKKPKQDKPQVQQAPVQHPTKQELKVQKVQAQVEAKIKKEQEKTNKKIAKYKNLVAKLNK